MVMAGSFWREAMASKADRFRTLSIEKKWITVPLYSGMFLVWIPDSRHLSNRIFQNNDGRRG